MIEINLTRGFTALADDEDFECLMLRRWHYHLGYAARTVRLSGGKKKKIYMHRLIMKTPAGMETDHINGNKLDNRRCNLRICTKSNNMKNIKKRMNLSSKYRGITWDKHRNLWKAMITINEKKVNIGRFKFENDAAYEYNEYAQRFHGEFAQLNEVTA